MRDEPRSDAVVGRWTARFRCALVLIDPIALAAPLVAEGTCEGEIIRDPRGESGFGYDPLFAVAGEETEAGKLRTFAELSTEAKNRRSHRAHALAALLPSLRRWLGLVDA
jgi:XTP/dITP diphosphohydrolase